MHKKIFAAIFSLVLFCACIFPCFATWPTSILRDSNVTTYSEIFTLVNADTGDVLLDKNARKRTAPASLTKIATAAVVLQNCADLKEKVAYATADNDVLYGTFSSVSGLKVGEVRTVYEMLACMLIPSGNDAAVALARHFGTQFLAEPAPAADDALDSVTPGALTQTRLSGDPIAAFVEKMNAFAKSAGCADTQFVNPHGLDEIGHYTTAADVLTMTRAAMEYPAFAELTSKTSYTLPASGEFPKRNLIGTNKMLNPGIKDYYSPYATGIKTGNTDDAGHCVVSFARYNGYSYFVVVMRGTLKDIDADDVDENTAFVDAKNLLAWAFENLRLVKVASPLNKVTEVPLLYAKEGDRMALCPTQDVYIPVPQGVDESGLLIVPQAETLPAELVAPVAANTPAGKAKVLYANQEIATIDLVTQTDAQRSAFLYAAKKVSDVLHAPAFLWIMGILLLLIVGAVLVQLLSRKKKRKPQRVTPSIGNR
ncbi:MAG: D-alanyl-D-alanine carboxypeptidase [Oscillospiraceae bacterium]|jgi:D-alanyl-D-alanine carboxypeptidase (penicillin-binding protein 5/6)|nr:D-alanyl-D-alanine carboxypeptidase [Oscillospiraceae bacterium]